MYENSETWTATHEFREPLRDLRSTADEADALHAELTREVSHGHTLYGVELRVIARATPQDDVVVETSDGRVALVHLTWSGHPETPPWPTTETVSSPADLEKLIELRY